MWKKYSLILFFLVAFFYSPGQEWPDWRGGQRDGIWNAKGILQQFKGDTIPLIWRVPCGPGYSGPTVAGGKLYLTDRPAATQPVERVLCLDAATGKPVWIYAYDCPYENVGYPAGPRASVVIHDGKAYSLGTMGHLFCFNAADGKIIWNKDLNREYEIRMPTWGIASTPLVTGNRIIIQAGGSGNACVVALDKETGAECWRSMEDGASYSAPIIISRGGKQILVVWTTENLAGLDPENGNIYWKIPHTVKLGMAIATPVLCDDYIFVSSFYSGSLLVRLGNDGTSAEKVWQRAGESERKTDALHCVINTPLIHDRHIYGVDSYGELRCLKLETGDRVWEDLSAVKKNRWANIHFVQHNDQIWMFNEHGELMITELSPGGMNIISRARLLEPTTGQLNRSGTGVTWSHPAFAGRFVYARNDREVVCASLAE